MQAERFVVFVLKAGAMPAPVHRCLCLSVILSHRTDIVPAGRSGRYVSAQIADRLAILKTKLPLRGAFVWLCTNLLRNSEEQFCRSYRTCLQYEKCLYQTIASSTPPFRALRELERGASLVWLLSNTNRHVKMPISPKKTSFEKGSLHRTKRKRCMQNRFR